MNWIIIAIISYSINAGVYVADKFLLSKRIHSSISYAFYVGIWSVFNAVILIFAPWLPTAKELAIDLSAGVLFFITLIFWYKALHQSEATRVVPVVGALVPIFSLLFSFIFLHETFDQQQMLAFFILIAGGVLISVKQTKLYILKKVVERLHDIFGNVLGPIHARFRPTRRLLINSFVAAFFFAAYYVLMKYIYSHQPFIGSFVWSRFGTTLGVIAVLFVPSWRRLIIEHQRGAETPKNLSFFLAVRLLAAIAFIMLNWAVSLGNVAMINALQGTQYLFLIFLVLILSLKFPHFLKEEVGRGVMIQKMIGVMLVSLGLWVLVS